MLSGERMSPAEPFPADLQPTVAVEKTQKTTFDPGASLPDAPTSRAAAAWVRASRAIGAHQMTRAMSRVLAIGDNRRVEHRTDEGASTMSRILRVNGPAGDPIGTAASVEAAQRGSRVSRWVAIT